MKTKKILALASFAMLMGSSVAIAQPNGKGAPQRGEEGRADKIAQELGLSEEQAASLQEINEKYADKNRATKENGEADILVAQQKNSEKQSKEIEKVLTAEQFEKYAELTSKAKKERRGGEEGRGERMRPEGQGRPQQGGGEEGRGERMRPEGQGRPQQGGKEDRAQRMTDRMVKELGLSEEQAASLLELNQKFAEDSKAAVEKLKEARIEGVTNLLTAEQQEKFAQMQAQQKERKEGGKQMRRGDRKGGEKKGAHRPQQAPRPEGGKDAPQGPELLP
ncbi:MAG: DUF4890 domain-containing protein [Rikenellaceae bacterium]